MMHIGGSGSYRHERSASDASRRRKAHANGLGVTSNRVAPILRNCGQTEFAGAIAFERPNDVRSDRRPEGPVAPGVEVAILNCEGGPLPVGEVAGRAPSSMSGYRDAGGNPADPGAWLRTGDLGKLDDDNFVYLVGRVRDMVGGGFNVYEAQVEAALNELPEVADSAMAGLPDERLGEVPVAAVVLTAGATGDADAIRQQLRSRLAAYELPRRVIFVTAMPRLDTGKVDRRGVARLLEAAQG
jgi:long-chain acyl-CoA synthetase